MLLIIIISILSFGCGGKSNTNTNTNTKNDTNISTNNTSSNTLITIGKEDDLGISPEDFKKSFNRYVNGYANQLEKDNKSGVNFKDFEIVATDAPNDKGEGGCFKLKNKMEIFYTVSEDKKLKKIAHLPVMSGQETFIHNPTEELKKIFIALVMVSCFSGDNDADKIITELKKNYDSNKEKAAFYELKDKGIAMYNIKDMYVFSILTKKEFDELKSKKGKK